MLSYFAVLFMKNHTNVKLPALGCPPLLQRYGTLQGKLQKHVRLIMVSTYNLFPENVQNSGASGSLLICCHVDMSKPNCQVVTEEFLHLNY